MFNAGIMGDIRVWVIPPSGSPGAWSFPLNWGGWVEHKRLICTRHQSLPGAMGSADFSLLRNTIADNSPKTKQPYTWDDAKFPIVAGAWVCVTSGTLGAVGAPLNPSTVLWFGFIDQIDGEQLAGTTELIGSVRALELGVMLDRIQASGWRRANSNNYPAPIDTPDMANIGGQLEGQVVGNAIKGGDGGGSVVWLFQNDPALCTVGVAANTWTRWRLLKHLQIFGLKNSNIISGANDSWTTVCLDGSQADDPAPATSTIAGYLNLTNNPEVYRLRNQSIKGMLDILIPRSLSLGWTIKVHGTATAVSLQITIYTLSDTATYGLPSFSSYVQAVDLSTLPVTHFERHSSSVDMPDEVIVEGNQIVFGVTGSNVDDNIDSGWTPGGTQETSYRAGASAGSGYSSLTTDEQLDRNRSIRQSPAMADVFTRFVLKSSSVGNTSFPGDLLRYMTPGAASGFMKSMCPEVAWTGGALSFSTTSRCPYLPTATLSRTLPWIDGYTINGTDTRPALLKPWPVFSTPKIFYYDSSKASNKQWIDLTAKGGTRCTARFDVDDRGAAMRIQYDLQERLGFGVIDLASDAIYDLQKSEKTFTEGLNGFSWKKLVVTFGIASDQRVSFRVRRPGISKDSDVRNSLKITDPRYNCWIMHGGSVLHVDQDGNPARVAGSGPDGSVVIRNDYPAIQDHANRVASFAFRQRNGFTYIGMRPDSPPAFASIGSAVSTVSEGVDATGKTVSITANTVVEAVECTYGNQPRIKITADLPMVPTLVGAISPAGGGPVAVTLNGTVPQAVQQTQQDVNALVAKTQRAPLLTPYSPSIPAIQSYLWTVQGGNVIPASGRTGIARRSPATVISPSELPNGAPGTGIIAVPAWPIPMGLPNGIGVISLTDSSGGVSYAFMRIDLANPYGNQDLSAGEPVFAGGLTNLDKVSGGTTWRYICYSGPYGYY